jgi:excisionase family DNA binding protein
MRPVKQPVNYFTTHEAAAELRLHEKTVRRWLLDGRLAGVRIGKLWRIPTQALRELLDGKTAADEIQAFCDSSRAALSTRR